jgi:hypothetical protein
LTIDSTSSFGGVTLARNALPSMAPTPVASFSTPPAIPAAKAPPNTSRIEGMSRMEEGEPPSRI